MIVSMQKRKISSNRTLNGKWCLEAYKGKKRSRKYGKTDRKWIRCLFYDTSGDAYFLGTALFMN